MTLVNRRSVRHAQVAAGLRIRPGVEGIVGLYIDELSARAMARHIRVGKLPAYQPSGAFEARWQEAADGSGWTVHATYTGQPRGGR